MHRGEKGLAEVNTSPDALADAAECFAEVRW